MSSAQLKAVRTVGGVTEYTLSSNGLRVLHRFTDTAPVVAVCVTYHVGSRNEAPGHTGSTHILEHLLFKDSKNFNRKNGKEITHYLEWMGAQLNATTWFDRTNYFELMPRERAKDALLLEADRMRNSLFSAEDLKMEMPVVRNEYEISRNNPFELLDEEVMATAFTKHPYRISTIGTKEDIESATAEKLRDFYDTFYWPNNATLALFGDISEREMKKHVSETFGKIPPSPKPIPQMDTVEPPQREQRFRFVQKEGGVSLVTLAYKIPEACHSDYPALLVLSTILGGGFGSRLEKALVDKGLAAEISVSAPALHDPSALFLVAHLSHATTPVQALSLMRAVCREAGRTISKKEIKRAQERLLSDSAFGRDSVFADVRAVSEWIAAGDWTLSYRLEEDIQKVTREDVMRVAKKYLIQSGETAGTLTSK